jgi:hypothetical protein
MRENEGKRCFTGLLNYWSNKTLESNMSLKGKESCERDHPCQRVVDEVLGGAS